MRNSLKWVFILSGLLWVQGIVDAKAQLISPGRLIEAHAQLDKIGSCTKCHSLGKRSIDRDLCLDCHIPLRNRLESDAGFHATLDETACATCHKDHFGRDFDPIRFDTTAFHHDDVGFRLVASHADVRCSSCHTEANITAPDVRYYVGEAGRIEHTFMGLDEACESCHLTDSKHGTQFKDRTCASCHNESEWATAPLFRHEETGYALTGKHTDVTCVACHAPDRNPEGDAPVVYTRIVSTACATCHRDIHSGAMGSTCTNCHSTVGWGRLQTNNFEGTFDHSTTEFTLRGAHIRLGCASCHNPQRTAESDIRIRFPLGRSGRTYPRPESSSCSSCHRDPHLGEFLRDDVASACTSCHAEVSWKPSSFGAIRHMDETRFPLSGAHVAVLCTDCHTPQDDSGQVTFTLDTPVCANCHREDNPHGDELGRLRTPASTCETCHSTVSWKAGFITFDHNATAFPLADRHADIACSACHGDENLETVRLIIPDASCRGCHAPDDPHQGQFENQLCSSCHDTSSFRLASFDHDRARFKLDETHARVACSSCHTPETAEDGISFVRFKPLGIACEDCHGGANE